MTTGATGLVVANTTLFNTGGQTLPVLPSFNLTRPWMNYTLSLVLFNETSSAVTVTVKDVNGNNVGAGTFTANAGMNRFTLAVSAITGLSVPVLVVTPSVSGAVKMRVEVDYTAVQSATLVNPLSGDYDSIVQG